MKISRKSILIIFLLMLLSCSFYSLEGSIPIHLRNVVIQPTINETSEYNVGKFFENSFSQLLLTKNLLSITEFQKADCQLQFKVKNVYDQPYLLDDTENATTVKQWKLQIVLSIEWYDLIKDNELINKDISESIVYSLDNSSIISQRVNDNFDFATNRDAAIEQCINNLINRIINELTSTW